MKLSIFTAVVHFYSHKNLLILHNVDLLFLHPFGFSEAVRRLDLQTVITQYYDMKTVRPELLRAVRDSLSDPEEVARISELLKDEVSI